MGVKLSPDVARVVGHIGPYGGEIVDPTYVCSWCREVIRQGTSRHVSHGMCDECAEGWAPEPKPAA